MLILNAGVLAGPELDYVRADVRVDGGIFAEVAPNLEPGPGEDAYDCAGMLMIPGLVNAHTHIGDSVAKDAAAGMGTDEAVHPVYGAKQRILGRTPPRVLAGMMRASCRLMLSKGITTFADFREGGRDGILLLREALRGVPIRCVMLGRLEHYGGAASDGPLPDAQRQELGLLLEECDGLGISGANENGPGVMAEYSKTPKIVAIHAAETEISTARSLDETGVSEVARALGARPHFLIHMTHASEEDLQAAAATRGIVACPRANAALGCGMPDIRAMRRAGCRVALGTDNVMVNSPDMFREMDYAGRMMEAGGGRADPREILQMATINGAAMLGVNAGAISPGADADCVLLDMHALELEPVHDPYSAIVHRATESAIRAVMVGGAVAHGTL